MANVIVKDLEVEAGKLLSFLTKAKSADTKVGQAAPTVIAALATILGAVTSSVTSAQGAAASGGLNLQLDAETLGNVKQVWPDVKAFVADIGIKL